MNIETAVINYLRETLETNRVYAEVPEVKTGIFFVTDKIGSSTENRICTSTVAIQSYAGSKLEASEQNERLKEAMKGITALDNISSCMLDTDYNYTNIAKKQYRYQAVYEITHY
jgi:uncharacterized protein YdaL